MSYRKAIVELPLKDSDSYWLRVLIAIDEFFNVLILNGPPYQTISQHAALAQQAGKQWGCVLCKLLDMVWTNHCADQLTDVEDE